MPLTVQVGHSQKKGVPNNPYHLFVFACGP